MTFRMATNLRNVRAPLPCVEVYFMFSPALWFPEERQMWSFLSAKIKSPLTHLPACVSFETFFYQCLYRFSCQPSHSPLEYTHYSCQQFMSHQDQENPQTHPEGEDDDQEDAKLLRQELEETPVEEFARQRKMAQECCDLGRKHLAQNDYESATKEFSKAVMTFEFILKNNLQHKDLKSEFADMLKKIIIPAYSNLSLCYLKMKKYNMVITFANQVLASDSANVKNLYRRGLARKGSKAFDEAIEDFEKVIKLDSEMEAECRKLISECKLLKIEQKKKEKEIAQKFIKGYAKNKPEASPASENSSAPLSLWQRSIRCIKGFCPKLFSKS